MSDNFDVKKYKKDSEVELEIELEKYIFFPRSKLKVKINVKPKKDSFKNNLKELKIILKLTQFLKYEYQYKKINGDIKDDSKSKNDEIVEVDFYRLNKNSFDIEMILPGLERKNFYPSFEYRKKEYFLFVRHLLTIEIPELKTSNSTGILICKLPEKIENIPKPKDLQENYFTISKDIMTKGGKLVYEFNIKKLIYSLNEKIPIKLIINVTDLKDVEIKSVEITIEKIIKILGKINIKFWGEKDEIKNITVFTKTFEEDEVKNKILNFSEEIEIDKNELPEFVKENNTPLNTKEIERFLRLDENFIDRDEQRVELNPSIKTDFFSCDYKVKFNIKFSNKKAKEVNEEFLINLYTLKPSTIEENIANYFNTEENPSFGTQTGQTTNK